MQKTITFFTCGGLEEPSGIGRYLPLAKELTRRGFHINYLALHPDFKSLDKRYEKQDGVDVYYVGQMHVLKKGSKKYYFNKFQLFNVVVNSTLKMLLKSLSLKSDILYCFKPQPINGFAALLAKFIKRKPLVLDCDDYEAELNRLTKLQKFIFILFEDNLPKFAKKVTFHSMFLKERYLRLGFKEDKFIQLSNGVDANRFSGLDSNKIKTLRKHFLLENKKVILYCGSLSLASGHAIDLLLKAFVIVKKQIPNAVLLLVGGGEDIDILKKQVDNSVKDSVIFAGKVKPSEIPYYIAISDISTDPVKDLLTNKGRCPIKIFESMALGVPVVTSDIGDRKLIIETDKAGILVKLGDYQDLARGIHEILSDEQHSKMMSKECRRIIRKYYWENLTEELLKKISF